MARFAKMGQYGVLLEAEVAPAAQTRFQKRYKATTRRVVTPGNPQYYKSQSNKWGTELRVYFNDPGMAASLAVYGIHVEHPRRGYRAGAYQYRCNDPHLWWGLVEDQGLRLGPN
jgi:hypothetical protein